MAIYLYKTPTRVDSIQPRKTVVRNAIIDYLWKHPEEEYSMLCRNLRRCGFKEYEISESIKTHTTVFLLSSSTLTTNTKIDFCFGYVMKTAINNHSLNKDGASDDVKVALDIWKCKDLNHITEQYK